MRKPLTDDEMFAWWRAALANKRHPGHESEPQPGWYKRRLVRGGPFVAARVWYHQDVDDAGELLGEPVLRCSVDGRSTDPLDTWTWIMGHPIEPEEYDRLIAPAPQHERASGAVSPVVDATKPINWFTAKPPF